MHEVMTTQERNIEEKEEEKEKHGPVLFHS